MIIEHANIDNIWNCGCVTNFFKFWSRILSISTSSDAGWRNVSSILRYSSSDLNSWVEYPWSIDHLSMWTQGFVTWIQLVTSLSHWNLVLWADSITSARSPGALYMQAIVKKVLSCHILHHNSLRIRFQYYTLCHIQYDNVRSSELCLKSLWLFVSIRHWKGLPKNLFLWSHILRSRVHFDIILRI